VANNNHFIATDRAVLERYISTFISREARLLKANLNEGFDIQIHVIYNLVKKDLRNVLDIIYYIYKIYIYMFIKAYNMMRININTQITIICVSLIYTMTKVRSYIRFLYSSDYILVPNEKIKLRCVIYESKLYKRK